MKKVKVFSNFANDLHTACLDTETKANDWLEAHPEATILDSHTNQSVPAPEDALYFFTITLIVDLPAQA